MDPDSLNFNSDDSQSGDESGSSDSLASGFLKNVDPADLAIVEKYVKDWDAGVTKKFQEIHSRYQPYKDLGVDDPEYLRAGYQLLTQLNSNPYETWQAIREGLIEMYGDDFESQFNGGGNQPPVGQNSLPEYEGIPEAFLKEFQSLKSEFEELKGFKQQTEQERIQQEEMKLLDNVMNELHTKHGDFDEDWVLVRLANGMSPEQAMQAWDKFVNDTVSSRKSKPAPPVLGGPGGIPSGQVDRSKLNGPTDRKALIAAALEAAQNG